MSLFVSLLSWCGLLGLVAWRGSRPPWLGGRAVLGLTLATLFWSPAWRGLGDGSLPLAGPEVAFLSVWMLVLLPILERRLERARLVQSLYRGLIAAAALGLVLDTSHLALGPLLGGAGGAGAVALTLGLLAIPFLAGLALCLLALPGPFPWDYPAWYAGLLLLVQPANPLLAALDLGAGHGAWTLGAALAVGGLARGYLGRPDGPGPGYGDQGMQGG